MNALISRNRRRRSARRHGVNRLEQVAQWAGMVALCLVTLPMAAALGWLIGQSLN